MKTNLNELYELINKNIDDKSKCINEIINFMHKGRYFRTVKEFTSLVKYLESPAKTANKPLRIDALNDAINYPEYEGNEIWEAGCVIMEIIKCVLPDIDFDLPEYNDIYDKIDNALLNQIK